MLILSFTLEIVSLSCPLLLFYLQMKLFCTKTHRCVEYTPKICFNSFKQSTVDAIRQSDEYPKSSLVSKTMKFLADLYYGYQNMDRSRHTVTKYFSDGNTYVAINSKLLKKLDHVNNALCEAKLAKAQIEDNDPIIAGFFILQYLKLRKLKWYWNFATNFSDVNKFGELEMYSDSLYLDPADKELDDCIPLELKAEWKQLGSKGCTDIFTANAYGNFIPRKCWNKHKKLDKRETGFSESDFRCWETLCHCSKTNWCCDKTSDTLKVHSKGLNRLILEQSGDDFLEKYCKTV